MASIALARTKSANDSVIAAWLRCLCDLRRLSPCPSCLTLVAAKAVRAAKKRKKVCLRQRSGSIKREN